MEGENGPRRTLPKYKIQRSFSHETNRKPVPVPGAAAGPDRLRHGQKERQQHHRHRHPRRDSYANCFAQFVVDNYAETHLIDLRFFQGSVTDYIEENGITQVLTLYNLPNFAADTALTKAFW